MLLLLLAFLAVSAPMEAPRQIDLFEFEDTSYGPAKSQSNDGRLPETTREDFSTGQFVSPVGSGDDAARSSLLEPDGKIVVGGRTNNGANDAFLIIRYHPDGTLDTSFGSTGKLSVSFGTSSSVLHSFAREPNGKIISVGKADSSAVAGFMSMGLLRVNTDGSLDTSFRTTGKFTIGMSNVTDIARKVLIDTTGKSVVFGYGWNGTRWKSQILRLTSDGVFDTSFATVGNLQTITSATDDGFLAGTLTTDGSLLAAGASFGADFDFLVVKYLAEGTLDTSFHTDGKVQVPVLAGDERAYAIALGTNGLFHLGGATHNGANLDYAVLRFLPDGNLDTSFKTSGKSTLAVGSADDQLNGLEVDTTGKILAAGFYYNGTNNDFALLRIKTDGNLDTAFETDGAALSPIGSNEDSGQALSFTESDTLIGVGRTYNGSNFDVAIIRYQTNGSLARSGALNLGFATGGMRLLSLTAGTEAIHNMQLQTDGKFVVTGHSNGTIPVTRFLPNGLLDTSFYTSGTFNFDTFATNTSKFSGVQIYTDGKIIAGAGNWNAELVTAKLLTSGALDTSYHTDGLSYAAFTYSAGMSQNTYLDGNNRVLASDLRVIRITTDGRLDTSFATDGETASIDYNHNITLLPNDSVYSYGFIELLSRYNSSGALDTTYSTNGLHNVNVPTPTNVGGFTDMAVEPQGRVTAVHPDSNGGGLPYTGGNLVRMHSSGTLDTSFSTSGIKLETYGSVSYPFPRVRLKMAPNGKVVLGSQSHSDFLIRRFLTNGELDTSFNTLGRVLHDVSGTDFLGDIILTSTGKICAGGIAADNYAITCYWP